MKDQMKLITVLFGVIMLISCKEKEAYSTIKNKQVSTTNAHKIVINETLNGGNYTYLNVNENGIDYWMAIPITSVEVGKTYYYDNGMIMRDFESKELEKTFDFITFGDGVRTTEKAVVTKQKSTHSSTNPSEIEDIKIETPENGVSLSTLFSKKESFSTKTIIVKGKVVKINNGILDRNWVHITDGTQFEGKKSLTVTTLEMVNVGDIITFEGTIVLDKNFGHGYIYDILLEDSKIIK